MNGPLLPARTPGFLRTSSRMPISIKVNGTCNSLAHKGTGGITQSTLPDVCKTPSPGGPVPLPYPVIVPVAGDLTKGTSTVKADGGNSIAIKGSHFGRCTGDEPGIAGGVKSGPFMKGPPGVSIHSMSGSRARTPAAWATRC
jgi:hypothetical protein